jgi:nucleoside-diphosphate-sugar epimerase
VIEIGRVYLGSIGALIGGEHMKRLLVTGATGKVGRHFIRTILGSEGGDKVAVRALCHNRFVEPSAGLEIVRGDIGDQSAVREAMKGVTHVVHCATCKETPEKVIDVTVKGLFWLLEECRTSATFKQIILIGGDAAVGHMFYAHLRPVTEQQRHSAYPGCYALSKVLEEVMLEQYFTQYNLSGCCLRAPWIMEKDDFRCSLSFGEDVFGGPRWRDLVGPEKAADYSRKNTVPIMLDPDGKPVKRNFVHLDDLVAGVVVALNHPQAHQQTFNICMDEPVDYGQVADYLFHTRGFPSVEISTPYRSTWLDNTKAKFLLGWRPHVDMKRLIEESWSYERSSNEPRRIWYPG